MKNKYPFSKQEGLKDCGAASLQMIIKYYGGYVSIEELNEMLNTTKNGTTAYDLIDVGKKLGFDSYGLKVSLNEIKENDLMFPIIVHTTINEKYNHFMVLYNIDFKKKKVLLADPQSAIKRMDFNEFEKIYNNIALVFYPIKPIVRKTEVFLNDIIISLFKKYKSEVKFLMIFSIILIILSVFSSFYIKILFDNYTMSNNLLFIIFCVFVLMNIFKVIINYFRTQLMIQVSKKVSFELNVDVCNKIINLPYRYYKNKTTGEILSKIIDFEKIQDTINQTIVVLLMDVPLALFSMIVLSVINFKLFIFSLLFLILYFLIFYIPRKYIFKMTDDFYVKRANYISFLEESISGFETVKNLNVENVILEKNEKNYIRYLKQQEKAKKFLNIQNMFKEIINNLYDLVIVFVGILSVKDGNMTIGSLLAFNSMQNFFFTPIRNVIDLDIGLIESKRIIKKVYEMLEKNTQKDAKIKSIQNIRIKNLSYSNLDNKILDKINLEIKKGEKIMLIGKSGSGKSTFLKILMGYFEIKRGKVMYDNLDINDVCNLKNKVTYVSQNEKLFTDSLKNNLSFYNGDIEKVAKDFFIDEIVCDNSLGYNMIIEEDGFNISGGQKQRIVLARACMKPFEILLIDEGLNQIDVKMERRILKNMFDRYDDKTIIIVSHRRNNFDLYDRVLKMKNGRILETK